MKTHFADGRPYGAMDLVNSFAPRLEILIALANAVLQDSRGFAAPPMSAVVASYISQLEGDWSSLVDALEAAEQKSYDHIPYAARRRVALWSVTLSVVARDLLAWEAGTLAGDDALERVRFRLDSLRWSAMALGELAGERALAEVRKERRERREEMDAYLHQVKIIEADEVDAPPLVHVGEALSGVMDRLGVDRALWAPTAGGSARDEG